MKLADGGKGVRKALAAQVQQGLDKYFDLERIKPRISGVLLHRRARQILQDGDHFFRRALASDLREQLIGHISSRKNACKEKDQSQLNLRQMNGRLSEGEDIVRDKTMTSHISLTQLLFLPTCS